jgi:hypothetical protein
VAQIHVFPHLRFPPSVRSKYPKQYSTAPSTPSSFPILWHSTELSRRDSLPPLRVVHSSVLAGTGSGKIQSPRERLERSIEPCSTKNWGTYIVQSYVPRSQEQEPMRPLKPKPNTSPSIRAFPTSYITTLCLASLAIGLLDEQRQGSLVSLLLLLHG